MTAPLVGELVRLRAREPEDEPDNYTWFNDTEVTENLSIRYPNSHRSQLEYLESAQTVRHGNANFAIEALADGRGIGGCSLEDVRTENRSAVLGIAIGDKTHWDGGYGTDTMRVLCRFGFEMMNLHRIELDVYAPNERAMHVYEKVGFRVEGMCRDALYKFGRYIDVFRMALLEGELR